MTRDEFLKKLNAIVERDIAYKEHKASSSYENSPSETHSEADMLLLEYINDLEITDAFLSLTRWYS